MFIKPWKNDVFPQTEKGRKIEKDSQSVYIGHCWQQFTGS